MKKSCTSALFAAVLAGCSGYPPACITSISDVAVGKLSVIRAERLTGGLAERKEPGGFHLLYGVSALLQVAPDTAALLANRNVYTPWGQVDFEDGADIFVIRSLDELKTVRPIECTRSGIVKDADYGGADRYHVNYGMGGGFVPLGARVGGKPHPAAGTGFGLCQITSHPVATNGTFSWQMPGRVSRCLEVFDLSYDGKRFAARLEAKFRENEPLQVGDTGWTFVCGGLGTAIPDGKDLLLPAMARKRDVAGDVCGLSRWRRTGGKWRPVDFLPVTGGGRGEPSVVRLRTGALLFAARDDHKPQPGRPNWNHGNLQDIHAWLSEDNGKTWTERVKVADVRMCSPIALGRADDGSVYFAGNPGYPEPILHERRNRMFLWPLSDRLDAMGRPVTLRDAKTDFTSGCGSWNMDHPIYSVIRFADGKVHGFLSYRVRDWWTDPKTGKGIAEPSADAGLYIEEITGRGESLPVWEF